MSNMPHCRFHNTSMDADDCLEALDDEQIANETERRNAKSLLMKFADYLQDNDLLTDENATSDEKITEFVNGLRLADED